MAQKVTVILVDDLDGKASDDVSTITFALDGVSYEIDLSDDNASNLRERLAEFVAAGRRTGGRAKRTGGPARSAARPTANREQAKTIREWARQNGFDMADRGRIPASVTSAFEKAHTVASKPKSRSGRTKTKAKELAFSS